MSTENTFLVFFYLGLTEYRNTVNKLTYKFNYIINVKVYLCVYHETKTLSIYINFFNNYTFTLQDKKKKKNYKPFFSAVIYICKFSPNCVHLHVNMDKCPGH